MVAESYIVEVIGWDKFNPRVDVKMASWFRCQHSHFYDQDFYDFTMEERATWLYILCEASKSKTRGSFTANSEHFHHVTRTNCEVLHQTVEKLKKLQLVKTRTLRGRYAHVLNPAATNDTVRDVTLRNDTVRDETTIPEQRKKTLRCSGVVISELSGNEWVNGMLKNVSKPVQEGWLSLYSAPGAEWIREEIQKAHIWIEANPRRRPKSIARFLTNWFSSGYERWRKTQPTNPATHGYVDPQILKLRQAAEEEERQGRHYGPTYSAQKHPA